ncbi:MAG: long-chain fatty acid--CoA ligase [Deltaproteobacteria bacterium]|nr:long-chain fatty acid--CoA ligase [Deltaproteobacteria bacterium]
METRAARIGIGIVRTFIAIGNLKMGEFSMDLAKKLEKQAQERGDQLFVIWHDQELTFDQLNASAAKMAAAMSAKGIRQGDVVAMMIPNIPPFMITYFAIQKLGAVALPINLLLQPLEVEYILNDSGAKTLIAIDMFNPLIEKIRERTPTVEQFFTLGENVAEWALPYASLVDGDIGQLPSPAIDADDLCTLMYTSGTTGKPKGVMLTHNNFLHQGKMIQDVFEISASDRKLLVLPLFHIFGLGLITMASLVSGSPAVLQEKFDPDMVLKEIASKEINLLFAVPTMYIALLQQAEKGGYNLPKTLRACLCGAAPLPVETVKQFEETFQTVIVEGYGLTESAGGVCVNPWDGNTKIGTIGLPMPGNDIKVVDPETGKELPAGEAGEVIIRGDNIMKGYLNLPEATAETIRDGWLYTGDLAKTDEDGYLTIIDRKKDLIIVGGENVYPREVEEAIYEYPGVMEVAVVGIPHPKMVEVPCASIALKPGVEASADDIVAFLEKRLAKFKVPRTIHFLNELPKSGSGKILRRMLKE